MTRNPEAGQPVDAEALHALADELSALHGCHTVVLYGSRARGTHRPDSDVDLLLVRRNGVSTRDVRMWRGVQVDAFVDEEAKLDPEKDEGLLRIRHGEVLRDEIGFGASLVRRAQEVFARGPAALPPGEVEALRVWGGKMLQRIASREAGAARADYRRVSLLTELLPLYFRLRRRWYLGSEEALRSLAEEEPGTYEAFERALEPGATLEAIEALVTLVLRAQS
jgi:predicted nucleotidyltransferase